MRLVGILFLVVWGRIGFLEDKGLMFFVGFLLGVLVLFLIEWILCGILVLKFMIVLILGGLMLICFGMVIRCFFLLVRVVLWLWVRFGMRLMDWKFVYF